MRAVQQRMLAIRFPRLRPWIWDLKQRREVTVGLIGGCIGALMVIGFLGATDANYSPVSPLGQAFTVQVSDSGVPYVVIDPDAVGQSGSQPTQANGGPQGRGGGGPLLILLFPRGGNLTFGGGKPSSGGDPRPSPDPQPKPGPTRLRPRLLSPAGPSPSPTPTFVSPGPSPSPDPSVSPQPSPDPSLFPGTSPSPDPSPPRAHDPAETFTPRSLHPPRSLARRSGAPALAFRSPARPPRC